MAESEPLAKENRILSMLKDRLGEKIKASSVKAKRIKLTVERNDLPSAAGALLDLGFDQVASVAGTDYPKENQMEVTYHIVSLGRDDQREIVAALAAKMPREDPVAPSLISIWPSCDWHERETHEMTGIRFDGHPRLGRVLLPEDWTDIPPLRKEFVLPGR